MLSSASHLACCFAWLCAASSCFGEVAASNAALGEHECGIRGHSGGSAADQVMARIVNGRPATVCEWPWQVSLRRLVSGRHFCGGTLISAKWVLTAGHCVTSSDSFNLIFGDFDRQSHSDVYQVERRSARVVMHPDYESAPMGIQFDFALVELDEEVQFGKCVSPACLPEEDVPVGEKCWITGWGTEHSDAETLPIELQEAEVVVADNEVCDEAYNVTGGDITDDMLCAQGINGSGLGAVQDACQGDSGGPLVCDSGDGHYTVHGATSWGEGCAKKEFPGIWARVFYVRDWIATVMESTYTVTSTTLPDFRNGSMWEVVLGPCQMDEDFCITSPNFPEPYKEDEACVIAVDASSAVPIVVDAFSTEEDYDVIVVNGEYYHGTKGPDGVIPTGTIFWSPDGFINENGWRLCPAATGSQPPAATATEEQAPERRRNGGARSRDPRRLRGLSAPLYD